MFGYSVSSEQRSSDDGLHPPARPDVLVEVEDVVRVDGVLERSQPGQHRCRVGAVHAGLPVVAERVDVCPARKRLDRPAHSRTVAIRFASSAGSVQRAAPMYSKAVPRCPKAVASAGTSAIAPPCVCRLAPIDGIVGQHRLDRRVGQRGEVVALPVAPQGVALRSVADALEVDVRLLDHAPLNRCAQDS